MIKFIYFDVGGVVIRDFSGTNKWEELLSGIGVTSVNREKFYAIWAASSGKRTTTFHVDDLLPSLRELNPGLPAQYSLVADFVGRFEKNEPIWPVISEMKRHVPVGLLTNQYPQMLDKIIAAGLMPAIVWDIVIDSSIVKLDKPGLEIYQLAEEKAKSRGSEILFIDNQSENIVTAKTLGWQTFLFDPTKSEESSKALMEYFDSKK